MPLSYGLEICHNTYVTMVSTHTCDNIYQIQFAELRTLKAIEVQDVCAQNICNFKITSYKDLSTCNPTTLRQNFQTVLYDDLTGSKLTIIKIVMLVVCVQT